MDENKKISPFQDLTDTEKLDYHEKVSNLITQLYSDENKMTRLVSLTNNIMKEYTRLDSINSREARDFIQDAFLKIYDGKRFFNGNTVEELYHFIIYILRSLIWNELKKTKYFETEKDEFGEKKFLKDKFISFNPADDDEENISDIMIKGTDTSILDRMIWQEEIDRTESKIIEVAEANNDPAILYLIEARLDGVPNPHKFVAEELGIDINEVRNAYKRLKNIINKQMRF